MCVLLIKVVIFGVGVWFIRYLLVVINGCIIKVKVFVFVICIYKWGFVVMMKYWVFCFWVIIMVCFK